ncbi:histone-like nucleoid-structuring protein Lsr2 [Streptomyces sp. NPDC091416]|uniref:Lsr2 family DNA-binding protein n=1 Tax=Streptomyces sp. NPDC091416 TaxID=3366003 RepID=UPI003816B862
MAAAGMTIAALQQLLAEEQPDVPRHPAPRIPQIIARKRKSMSAQPPVPGPRTPQAAPSAGLTVATTGALITWAEKHPTKSIARKGQQARELLQELRELQAADEQLAQAEADEQRLLRELEAVRARREQLRPKRKAVRRDYDQGEVRAWATSQGLAVPSRGQIPKAVLQAWREQNGGAR